MDTKMDIQREGLAQYLSQCADNDFLYQLRDGFELDVSQYRSAKAIVKRALSGDIPVEYVHESDMEALGHPHAAALAGDGKIRVRYDFNEEEIQYLISHEGLELEHDLGRMRPNKSAAEEEHVELERLVAIALGDLRNDREVGDKAKAAFRGYRTVFRDGLKATDPLATALYLKVADRDGYTHEQLFNDLYRARDEPDKSPASFYQALKDVGLDATFWAPKSAEAVLYKGISNWVPFVGDGTITLPSVVGWAEKLVKGAIADVEAGYKNAMKTSETHEKAPPKTEKKEEPKKEEKPK